MNGRNSNIYGTVKPQEESLWHDILESISCRDIVVGRGKKLLLCSNGAEAHFKLDQSDVRVRLLQAFFACFRRGSWVSEGIFLGIDLRTVQCNVPSGLNSVLRTTSSFFNLKVQVILIPPAFLVTGV